MERRVASGASASSKREASLVQAQRLAGSSGPAAADGPLARHRWCPAPRLSRADLLKRLRPGWCTLASLTLIGLLIAVGVIYNFKRHSANQEALWNEASAAFGEGSVSLAISAQNALTSTRRLRNMMVSPLEAIGENATTTQFRDQASTLLQQTPIMSSAFMVRPLMDLDQRLEWERRMSEAVGSPVQVNDGMGTIIPYDASATRVLYPVEVPSSHEIVCLSGVIGGDMGAHVPTRRAIGNVLASRAGAATWPMSMVGFHNLTDRHVFEFRSLRWAGQLNATTGCVGNCTLMGMPTAGDFQAGGVATAGTNTTTAGNATLPLPQRISGLVFSGQLFSEFLVDAARSSDWYGKQLGAMTVEDVTDVPAYAALKLTSPAASAREAWAISWRDVIAPITGTGEAMLAVSASASGSGSLRETSLLDTVAHHRSSDLTRAYILEIGGRDLALVVSPKASYLQEKLSSVDSMLTASMISTAAVVVFMCIIIIAVRSAWARSRREHYKQLEVVRDRQQLQEQMTSFLSHELRNPSHVISSCAEHVLERLGPAHECKVDMDAIRDSAEAMHRLINDVLTWSAISHRRLEIKHSMFDIRSFVHRIVRSHRSFATVPILFTVDRAVPACMISDVMRLQQISANALSNASKFCDTGEIRVSVTILDASQPPWPNATEAACSSVPSSAAPTASSSLVTLASEPISSTVAVGASTASVPCPVIKFCICDSGPGLSGNLDNLFVPFATNKRNVSVHTSSSAATGHKRSAGRSALAQSDDSASSSYAARVRGSGLGLPVSKMLAQLLGGDIALYRDQDVQRTVFCFTVPLVPPAHWPALHGAWQEQQRTPPTALPVPASPRNVVAEVGTPLAVVVPVSAPVPDASAPAAPAAAPSGGRTPSLAPLEAAILNFTSPALSQLFVPPRPAAGPRSAASSGTLLPSTRSPTGSSSDDAPGADASSLVTSTSTAESVNVVPDSQRVYALGLHVLVVDDERLNRQVVARMLTRLGCTYELAEDGDEAEDVLVRSGNVPQPAGTVVVPVLSPAASPTSGAATTSSDSVTSAHDASESRPGSAASSGLRVKAPAAEADRRPFDVVLMDIIMRRRCGKETTRRLRAAGMTTPVFAATGNLPGPEFATLFNGVIEKPFTVQKLGALLSGLRAPSLVAAVAAAVPVVSA